MKARTSNDRAAFAQMDLTNPSDRDWRFDFQWDSDFDFNKDHPEKLDNEIFLINIEGGEVGAGMVYPELKTLRIGNRAYNRLGGFMHGCHPLFADEDEYNRL